MVTLQELRESLPEAAKDARVNLQNVLQQGSLTPAQRYGVAIASAVAARSAALRDALVAEAEQHVGRALVEDAFAAASIMAMNNVYYRFRHVVGKPSYSSMPARLRMQAMARPATNKADFELVCLALSAINNCETCVKSHEAAVLEAGITEEQVHDAVRTAAVISAAAVSLDLVGAASLEPVAV